MLWHMRKINFINLKNKLLLSLLAGFYSTRVDSTVPVSSLVSTLPFALCHCRNSISNGESTQAGRAGSALRVQLWRLCLGMPRWWRWWSWSCFLDFGPIGGKWSCAQCLCFDPNPAAHWRRSRKRCSSSAGSLSLWTGLHELNGFSIGLPPLRQPIYLPHFQL